MTKKLLFAVHFARLWNAQALTDLMLIIIERYNQIDT